MQTENFKNFFFVYGRYKQYDLVHSLEQETKLGRNIDLLLDFRELFKLIIATPEIDKQDYKEVLEAINASIDCYIGEFKNECLNLGLNKIIDSNFDFSLFDAEFKDILSDFCVSCGDFRIVDRLSYTSTQSFRKDKEDRSVLTQALLEFNNALSHLFVCVYNGTDTLNNIQKAKNHLYRGTLDNYKMVFRTALNEIRKKNKKLYKMFKDIREYEFLKLGTNINEKTLVIKEISKEPITIIQAFQELYNLSFNQQKFAK